MLGVGVTKFPLLILCVMKSDTRCSNRVADIARRATAQSPSCIPFRQIHNHVSHSLNSLKGDYLGYYIGDYYRAYLGGY